MNVVFRVDASTRTGLGHVMRCGTLAQALALEGAQVVFICRKHPGNQIDLLRSDGFVVLELPAPQTCERIVDGDYVNWLGASQEVDAVESLNALSQAYSCIVLNANEDQSACGEQAGIIGDARANIDWLIVDHYSLDETWERKLRPSVGHIVVIDDLANRQHDCDIMLDQNLGRVVGDYSGLIPQRCTSLIGPRYALLRPEFLAARAKALRRRTKRSLRNVLITMGGMDQVDATSCVLRSLLGSPLSGDVRLTVIMGSSAPALDSVMALASSMPWQTEVVVDATNMAELMSVADICIGAAGSTTWERCCLGLPSVILETADNQAGIGLTLEEVNAAVFVGSMLDDKFVCRLHSALAKVSEIDRLYEISMVSSGICDGEGASRVASALLQWNESTAFNTGAH